MLSWDLYSKGVHSLGNSIYTCPRSPKYIVTSTPQNLNKEVYGHCMMDPQGLYTDIYIRTYIRIVATQLFTADSLSSPRQTWDPHWGPAFWLCGRSGYGAVGLGHGSFDGTFESTVRVQVPNNHILTQNLYHIYYYPKPKYLIIGFLGLCVKLPEFYVVLDCVKFQGFGVCSRQGFRVLSFSSLMPGAAESLLKFRDKLKLFKLAQGMGLCCLAS